MSKSKIGPNVRCPECGKKMKHCKGHSNINWRSIRVVIIMTLIVIIGFLGATILRSNSESENISSESQPKSDESSNTVKTVRVSPGDGFLGAYLRPDGSVPNWMAEEYLSDESLMFIAQEIIGPMTDEILEEYPIPSLRQQVAVMFSDNSVVRGISRVENFHELKAEGKHPPNASTIASKIRPGFPEIRIFVDSFRDMMFEANVTLGPSQARDAIVDFLLDTLLHEYYHAKRQTEWQLEGMPRDVFLAREAEVWAYMCREVFSVMKEHGRGNLIPSSVAHNLYETYVSLDGDTTDPRWMEAIEWNHPPYQ